MTKEHAKLFWGVLVFLMIIGCTANHNVKVDGTPVSVGKIPALRSLDLINDSVTDNIYLKAYPNDIICIYVPNGGSSLSVCLDENLRNKIIEDLNKSITWSDLAKKEHVEISKQLDFIKNDFMGAYSGLNLQFTSINQGNLWALKLDFNYYNAFEATKYRVGKYKGEEVTMFVPEQSVKLLLSKLKNSDHIFEEARENQSKVNLFK